MSGPLLGCLRIRCSTLRLVMHWERGSRSLALCAISGWHIPANAQNVSRMSVCSTSHSQRSDWGAGGGNGALLRPRPILR